MKKNLMQLGRSMVEMLGVLAIIGVLSIVGIQGYKKAMLRNKANDMWDVAMKFKNDVDAMRFVNPDENCGGTKIYVSAPSYESVKDMPSIKGATAPRSYCYLDRSDLIPSWASGDPTNFMALVDYSGTKPSVEIRHIRIGNLCSTFLPNGAQVSGTITRWRWMASGDGNNYECRRFDSGIAF